MSEKYIKLPHQEYFRTWAHKNNNGLVLDYLIYKFHFNNFATVRKNFTKKKILEDIEKLSGVILNTKSLQRAFDYLQDKNLIDIIGHSGKPDFTIELNLIEDQPKTKMSEVDNISLDKNVLAGRTKMSEVKDKNVLPLGQKCPTLATSNIDSEDNTETLNKPFNKPFNKIDKNKPEEPLKSHQSINKKNKPGKVSRAENILIDIPEFYNFDNQTEEQRINKIIRFVNETDPERIIQAFESVKFEDKNLLEDNPGEFSRFLMAKIKDKNFKVSYETITHTDKTPEQIKTTSELAIMAQILNIPGGSAQRAHEIIKFFINKIEFLTNDKFKLAENMAEAAKNNPFLNRNNNFDYQDYIDKSLTKIQKSEEVFNKICIELINEFSIPGIERILFYCLDKFDKKYFTREDIKKLNLMDLGEEAFIKKVLRLIGKYSREVV